MTPEPVTVPVIVEVGAAIVSATTALTMTCACVDSVIGAMVFATAALTRTWAVIDAVTVPIVSLTTSAELLTSASRTSPPKRGCV